MRKALFYGTVLIGTYIVVANGTGFGKSISAATTGSANVIKSLQGR